MSKGIGKDATRDAQEQVWSASRSWWKLPGINPHLRFALVPECKRGLWEPLINPRLHFALVPLHLFLSASRGWWVLPINPRFHFTIYYCSWASLVAFHAHFQAPNVHIHLPKYSDFSGLENEKRACGGAIDREMYMYIKLTNWNLLICTKTCVFYLQKCVTAFSSLILWIPSSFLS